MKKKVIIVVIVLLFLGVALFVVMQMKRQNKKELDVKADVIYVGTNLTLDGIEGRICSYKQNNGNVYILTQQEPNGIEQIYHMYSMNNEENNQQPVSFKNSGKVIDFCVDESGSIIYISEDDNAEQPIVDLVKIDQQGKELAKQNIDSIIQNKYIYLCGMVADRNGQIVLACRDGIYFLDESLQIKDKVVTQTGDDVVDIALAKTGEIVCVTDRLNSDEVAIKVQLLDPVKKSWGDILSVSLDMAAQNDYIIDGYDHDFYFKASSGIYGYDVATKEKKEIINYDASYMTSSDTDGFVCIGEDKFIGKTESIVENKIQYTLVSYAKQTDESLKEKQIIRLGTMYARSDLKSAVAKFNRSNPKYKIVIEEYINMDMDRLLIDFANGKGQDIIDLASFPLSIEQCISKGIVEDLTPYYEKDSEVTGADLIQSVREAMEYDGKLYYVTPSFSIKTMAAKTKDVGRDSGWTVAEMKKLIDTKGENAELFSSKDVKIGCLEYFVFNNMSDYIDWETGICTFDSEEFKYLLELCNKEGIDEEMDVSMVDIQEEANSVYSRFKNNEYLLLQEQSLDLNQIQLERKIIADEVTYIGYPGKDKKGSLFLFNSKYGISAQSELKEPAWDFIRSFLSKEYQKSIEYEMPVIQEMFDYKLKQLTATEVYTDEFGEIIQPVEERTMTYGDIEVEIGIPTQEDVETYINIINQTKYCVDGDGVIFNIILEEATDYFKGKKSLDKTVEVIQNRVTTYVNENR